MSSIAKVFAFKASSEVPSQLTARVVNIFCAPQTGKYDVTYKTYRRGTSRLGILQFSEDNDKLYVLSDTIYVLGIEFETILIKSGAWTLRQTMRLQGTMHEFERFQHGKLELCHVKIGVASQGPLSKALIVELAEHSEQLIGELVAPFPILLDMQRFEGSSAAAYFEMFSKI